MFEDQPWLQILLRRAPCPPVEGHGQENYRNGFDLTLQPHMLEHPLRWRQPRRVFVNSMSDLFHEDVPSAYIKLVFDVMRRACWHQFQLLTKRSERLLELDPMLNWQPQIWMGVSIENEDYLYRADQLKRTGATIKFLSVEPLLGPLGRLNLRGIDWVIVGGESGPGARPVGWRLQIADRPDSRRADVGRNASPSASAINVLKRRCSHCAYLSPPIRPPRTDGLITASPPIVDR